MLKKCKKPKTKKHKQILAFEVKRVYSSSVFLENSRRRVYSSSVVNVLISNVLLENVCPLKRMEFFEI